MDLEAPDALGLAGQMLERGAKVTGDTQGDNDAECEGGHGDQAKNQQVSAAERQEVATRRNDTDDDIGATAPDWLKERQPIACRPGKGVNPAGFGRRIG